MGNCFLFVPNGEITVPNGERFIHSDDLFVVSKDYKSLFLFNNYKFSQFFIGGLNLDLNKDKILNVGCFAGNAQFFFFVVHISTPTMIIYDVESNQIDNITLSSLYFHYNIMSVFSPYPNAFCVISREGFGIYSRDSEPIYLQQMSIEKALFYKNILLIISFGLFTFYKFRPNSQPEIMFSSSEGLKSILFSKQKMKFSYYSMIPIRSEK